MDNKKLKSKNFLTFKILKKDNDFLEKIIEEFYKENGVKLSKAGVIRKFMIQGFLCFIDDPLFTEELNILKTLLESSFPTVRERYDVNKLTNIRKSKKHYDNESNESLKVIKIRMSDEEKKSIEENLHKVKEVKESNISIGDFIRFCINAEREYHNQK
ncbi:MAG TPA: hypothetical protein ACHBZ9_06240 [Arsenophonus nasoniae]|uniref:hypothetical protein n=1 Tax=Arsenophonus nasoniae TaxID=638 RepID=UPI00387A2955